jgi:ribosomal protein S18 acetylase RimI-like enzyme
VPKASTRKAKTHLRRGSLADLDDLTALENTAFKTDRMSRRSFRHVLTSRAATLIVAVRAGAFAGYALVLFRPRSAIGRLYSIAVAPHMGGRGIGSALLAAAEAAILRRGCTSMRLEVHDHNTAAIGRYEKSGYRLFGRHPSYYDDGGDALRFEKALRRPARTKEPRRRR